MEYLFYGQKCNTVGSSYIRKYLSSHGYKDLADRVSSAYQIDTSKRGNKKYKQTIILRLEWVEKPIIDDQFIYLNPEYFTKSGPNHYLNFVDLCGHKMKRCNFVLTINTIYGDHDIDALKTIKDETDAKVIDFHRVLNVPIGLRARYIDDISINFVSISKSSLDCELKDIISIKYVEYFPLIISKTGPKFIWNDKWHKV